MHTKKPRINRNKTSGEIYIGGIKYKCKDENKDNIIEWLKTIQDKYS